MLYLRNRSSKSTDLNDLTILEQSERKERHDDFWNAVLAPGLISCEGGNCASAYGMRGSTLSAPTTIRPLKKYFFLFLHMYVFGKLRVKNVLCKSRISIRGKLWGRVPGEESDYGLACCEICRVAENCDRKETDVKH